MDVYHWPSPAGNFGDDLNQWLWDCLLPGRKTVAGETLIVGVGTVLEQGLLPPGKNKLVLGSGTGYGGAVDVSDSKQWDIRFVRGELTATVLGLPSEKAVIDPAVVLSDMPEFQGLEKKLQTVFVPHWQSAVHGEWEQVCKRLGIGYINPCGDARAVIKSIAQAELVIAESMHAAIIADAFRVPWIAVATSDLVNPFKWNDWLSVLGMTYSAHKIPLSSPLEAVGKGQAFLGIRRPGFMVPKQEIQHEQPQASEIRPGSDVSICSVKGLLKRFISSQVGKWVFATPATWAMKRVLRAKPQLSSDELIARQKAKFYSVIDEVKIDYGFY